MSNTIITIGRQYGSGGREIGEKLAEKLGYGFYDQHLIELAAEKGNYDPKRLEEVDEKKANVWLYSVPVEAHAISGMGKPINDLLFSLQTEVIKQIALKASCVIIGRCADSVLKEEKKLYSVFIYADLPSRIQRVMARQGVSEKEAAELIKKTDKQRSCYYNFYSDKRWGHRDSYHISLDSGRLGVDTCVEILRKLGE